jgi:hypothetical protein
VDAKQFDELVARLTSGPSRRDALKGALGGALAAIGLSAGALSKGKGNGKKGRGKGGAGGEGKGRGKKGRGNGPGAQGKGGKGKNRGGAKSDGIANNGSCRCPGDPPKGKTKRQRRRPRPCERCNSGFFQKKDNGRCICTCRPDRTTCTADKPFQCCSGICQSGQCVSYGDAAP